MNAKAAESKSHPLIQFKNIAKHYAMGDQVVKALDDIDLTVMPNEYLAFIGSSGSGKSTLMNILGCLDQPTHGEYWLNGQNVASQNQNRLAEIRNSEIGFIFQSFNLLPRATALSNVMLPLIYQGVSYQKRKQLAEQALEKVNLADRMVHLPNQLSGGQRQRVAIARALVTRPSLLLADEPTGNLDTKTSRDIMALFDQLHQEGQTIMLVTHEDEIARHCQRVIRLCDGKIVSDSKNPEAACRV